MGNTVKSLSKKTFRHRLLAKTFGENNFLTKVGDPITSPREHLDPLGLFNSNDKAAAVPAPPDTAIDPALIINARRSQRRRAGQGGLGSTILAGDNSIATGQGKTLLGS